MPEDKQSVQAIPTTALPLASMQANAAFFDHLVELIPSRHYFEEGEKSNPRFLAKAARQAAKQQVSLFPGLISAVCVQQPAAAHASAMAATKQRLRTLPQLFRHRP
jgi:hypothetical protein